jgi:hypothetical protein
MREKILEILIMVDGSPSVLTYADLEPILNKIYSVLGIKTRL